MQTLGDILSAVAADRMVTADEVLAIRAAIYPDMMISQAEADALFALNDRVGDADPEWGQLFVEAMCDYVVRQQEPTGYVDAAKADWLLARISADGRIKSDTEFALLIRVIQIAVEAPSVLADTALDYAVAFTQSPERRAGQGMAITGEEVERLRQVIWATASDGGQVSHREAEALFALNDAARGQANDPAWRDLFVKAIGAAVLAATTYRPHSRQEAQRLQAWLESPTEGVGGILARTFSAFGKSIASGTLHRGETDELAAMFAARNRTQAEASEVADDVTAEEASWLISRIGKDGRFDDNEIALLRFTAEEADVIDPRLEPLIEAALKRSSLALEAGPQAPAAPFGRRVTA